MLFVTFSRVEISKRDRNTNQNKLSSFTDRPKSFFSYSGNRVTLVQYRMFVKPPGLPIYDDPAKTRIFDLTLESLECHHLGTKYLHLRLPSVLFGYMFMLGVESEKHIYRKHLKIVASSHYMSCKYLLNVLTFKLLLT